MKRPASLPVLVQVAALAVLAVVMSQAVAFAVVVLAPDPRPTGFSIAAAAKALQGRPAETADGRPLSRRISDRPLEGNGSWDRDPIAVALTLGLAQSLGASPDAVRVRMDRAPGRKPPDPDGPDPEGEHRFVFERGVWTPNSAPPDSSVVVRHGARITGGWEAAPRGTQAEGALKGRFTDRQFTILVDRLTFAPFSASLRLDDGRWATVEPPRGLLSPWQRRFMLAMLISMLLLAPVVWLLARRLTRPIRVFAAAAERLGADPDAPPLSPSGPSEVRTAIHAFNDMQASLRDHMRRRTQTVAAIAHDLRTPLTRLRFRAEQAPEAVRDRMAADIEEMDDMIAQAMAYVRGEVPGERRERFDLAALAADCAGGFAETGADVVFHADGVSPVVADPAALRRALANLIDNALKYGGEAKVRAFLDDGRAIVTVEDDGPGLPDDELEAVFHPFHRGERSRSRETGGAGLGLTVARQAARAHGGDVTVANRAGGGLVASLSLPLNLAADAPPRRDE